MKSAAGELETPVLLLAMPQVLDPFFHKGVVLLLHHNQEGSFGFVVNRPTEIHVAEILKGMQITWQGDQGALAYFGGPVQPQIGTVLFAPLTVLKGNGHLKETASEVLPGIGISNHIADLAQLAEAPPERFRLLLGYAGWGEGQLVEEILRNDWLTAPIQPDLIFAPQPDTVWSSALASVGVDPATLPAWTPGGDSDAN